MTEALGEIPVPVVGVLCFVGPNWRRFFPRPLAVRGTPVVWPAKVAELVRRDGLLAVDDLTALPERLARVFRPA